MRVGFFFPSFVKFWPWSTDILGLLLKPDTLPHWPIWLGSNIDMRITSATCDLYVFTCIMCQRERRSQFPADCTGNLKDLIHIRSYILRTSSSICLACSHHGSPFSLLFLNYAQLKLIKCREKTPQKNKNFVLLSITMVYSLVSKNVIIWHCLPSCNVDALQSCN